MPAVVDRAPPAEGGNEEGVGTLTPGFERGALLLKDDAGGIVRLSWEDGDDAGGPRALPEGSYTLVGYRILADDEAGTPWHVSATGSSIRDVVIESGVNRDLEIDASIRISSRVHAGRIQIAIRGEHGAGLSIYKEGRRIPIDYRLRDASGTELASGRIEYG